MENATTTLIAVGMLASCIFPLGIALRLSRHRDPHTLAPLLISRTRRLAPLFAFLTAISLWVGAYALELLLDDFLLSVWMHRLVFVGVVLTPPAVLLAALEATGRRLGRTGETFLWSLLVPIPAISILLTLTNDHQALFWTPGALHRVGALTPLGTVHGPWYWVHTAFSYSCVIAAFLLLAHRYIRSNRRLGEAPAVAVAFLIPWAANALHVFFHVGASIDLTPPAFVITGVLLYRIMHRDIHRN